jgi:hypothetical protein
VGGLEKRLAALRGEAAEGRRCLSRRRFVAALDLGWRLCRRDPGAEQAGAQSQYSKLSSHRLLLYRSGDEARVGAGDYLFLN